MRRARPDLYFNRVPSPPATDDGSVRPLAKDVGIGSGGGEAIARDADAEPGAGAARADGEPRPAEAEPHAAEAEPHAAEAEPHAAEADTEHGAARPDAEPGLAQTNVALLPGPQEADLDSPDPAGPRLDAGLQPQVRYVDPNPGISSYGPRFTPDGKALVYPIRRNGLEELWLQPLDGSPGRQITNFKADQIHAFYFSPDGKSIGVLTARHEYDVILLHDTGLQ